MSAERPLTHPEYIDDYLLMDAGIRSDAHGLQVRMADPAERARAHSREMGFPVHKEEIGDSVTTLGHLVGGDPPCVVAAPTKRWLAVESCWELAQRGRGLPRQVESVISLCSWMVRRGGLSTFQEVYKWCRLNRECRGALVIPREVRRELAVAATLVLLIEQRLDAPWFPAATLFDASDLGGGIYQSLAMVEELQSEARWAVRVVGSRRSGAWGHFKIYSRPRMSTPNSRSSLRFHVP